VITATARALVDGWLPAGDQANIAIRAHDVLTSRTPLLGLHSDVSAVTHHDVYSLGPMLFWLLAIPSRIGAPSWMTLTMGLLNTAAIVGVVALARRRGGVALMLASAVGIVLMSRSLSPEVLHDIWNPSAGLFPFTLLIFLCWSLACGEHRLLPLTALTFSFVVQCQMAFVPPCVGLVAVGLAGLAVHLRGRRDARGERRRGRVWPWAAAAAVVLAACWTPPLIDQLRGHPGNITRVLETAKARPPELGPGVGARALVRAVGVPPWWLRSAADPWHRKVEVRTATGAVADVTAAAIVGGLLALAWLGLRRRRTEIASAALLALVLCAALFAVAAATPTQRVLAETLGYTLWWASPAGMFVWLALLWGGASLLPVAVRRAALAPALAAAAVALVAGSTAVALAERADYHQPEYAPLAKLYSALGRGVPGRSTVNLIGGLGTHTFRFKMAARFALVRRGVRPLSPGTDVRLGSWYELDHRAYRCTVYVEDGSRSPQRGATRIAAFAFEAAFPVSVWVAPAGCPPRAASSG
jgi:hypothetical protein